MRLDVPVAEIPHFELFDDLAEVLLERPGVRVGIDEHEPRPGSHLAFGQCEVVGALVDVGEVPRRRHVGEVAGEVPGEAVECAAQFRAATVVLLELATSVEAGIRERLDRPVGLAHDQIRLLGDLVDDVVAGLGDVVLSAGELPDSRPQLVDFTPVPLAAGVPLDRDVFAAEVASRFEAEYVRDRMRVGVEEVLEAQTGRAGAGVCNRLIGGSHGTIIDHAVSFNRHRTARSSSSRASASIWFPTWIVVHPSASGSTRFWSKSSRYTIAS